MKITEEDGEIDAEFSALDSSKECGLFGFDKLALVLREDYRDESTQASCSYDSAVNLNESLENKVTVIV